jgi:hypothetical protein
LLGVIFARRSPLNLEAIAEEMQRLNAGMPATLWPDMVAVADTGVVQYSAQFPGENVTGDFFLPGERLVEEVTAHLLQRRLMDGVTITEVPRDQRASEAPERFRVTLAVGGLTPWTIAYHGTAFEET